MMSFMPNKEYIDRARLEIAKWESEGPGYLAKLGNFVLSPVDKAFEVLVPDAVQHSVANAIEIFLNGLSVASRISINTDEICSRVQSNQEGDDLDLRGLDIAAKHYCNWHIGYATAEGAATGAVGIAGLAADIPALFTIAIRLIQEISTCYGYDPYDENEREYILHVLQTGATGDIKAKIEFLVGLKQVEQVLLKVAWKQMNQALARKELSKQAALAALRQFARTLGIQVTKRKALQAIPVFGALIGASFNATLVNDVGRAAYMSYRRRWIQEKIDPRSGPGNVDG